MGLTHELSDAAATTEAHEACGEDTGNSAPAHDHVAVVIETLAHETHGDHTGISAPAHDRVAVPDDEQGNAASPAAKQATPPPPADSASAQRRFNSFALKVKRPKPEAILQRPSPDRTVRTPRQRLLRSRRIAAQSLSRIPASKRGEYLVLKRLGQASPLSKSTAKTKFDALFGQNPEDDEALRELFPDGTNIDGRRRRRRAPRARA
jgi:AraC-like DNA-binding protein